jgi:hypothetical protein
MSFALLLALLRLASPDECDGSPDCDSCISWAEDGTCTAYISDDGTCVSTEASSECDDDGPEGDAP